jgi:hypothetical protein
VIIYYPIFSTHITSPLTEFCAEFVLTISFPVALQPNFDLGRLHETFRFISVTRSRTFGWTPWTSDQFVSRHLLTAPGDCDDGEVGRMKRFLVRETEVPRENLPRCHFVHHKSHLPDPGSNLGCRGGKPATNRFSYGVALMLDIPITNKV